MTREEAIKQLRNLKQANFFSSTLMALDMAIEALKTVQEHKETFEWCTDCKEYDQENHCCHRWSKVIRQTRLDMEQEFGIVRCEDCKHWVKVASACTKNSLGTYSWEYCSDGERRKP